MMRLLAALATLAALGAAGLGGQALWQALENPLPPAPQIAAAPDPATTAPASGPERQPPPRWPALFGEPQPPEPQPPTPPKPKAEPQPPAPPAPPLESLGYALKGVVSDGGSRWAIVAHPTGDRLLRRGDRLGDDYTVVAIDEAGLWLETAPGGDRSLLGFSN